jgi:hypothetical protein
MQVLVSQDVSSIVQVWQVQQNKSAPLSLI